MKTAGDAVQGGKQSWNAIELFQPTRLLGYDNFLYYETTIEITYLLSKHFGSCSRIDSDMLALALMYLSKQKCLSHGKKALIQIMTKEASSTCASGYVRGT